MLKWVIIYINYEIVLTYTLHVKITETLQFDFA